MRGLRTKSRMRKRSDPMSEKLYFEIHLGVQGLTAEEVEAIVEEIVGMVEAKGGICGGPITEAHDGKEES